ncbi:MAG: phosphoribosylformylglycinamidine cyclo-ligase, partial [Clostridia bacterium]|nr:phosphoribosylformylglycinamidine cyclo-ligase [Clostridia bacterium]
FSLVRKLFKIGAGGENRRCDELEQPLWETLLTPTKIYVKPVLSLLKQITVKGISHITGGGFYENIPRALREGVSARIEKKDVRRLPIFDLIQKEGDIPERDMYNTYNMGVGMCLVVSEADADRAISVLKENGESGAYVLGALTEGEKGVILC